MDGPIRLVPEQQLAQVQQLVPEQLAQAGGAGPAAASGAAAGTAPAGAAGVPLIDGTRLAFPVAGGGEASLPGMVDLDFLAGLPVGLTAWTDGLDLVIQRADGARVRAARHVAYAARYEAGENLDLVDPDQYRAEALGATGRDAMLEQGSSADGLERVGASPGAELGEGEPLALVAEGGASGFGEPDYLYALLARLGLPASAAALQAASDGADTTSDASRAMAPASPPTASPPATSPPTASPPATSPPTASPPATSPPATSPPVTSPPVTSPPVVPPAVDSAVDRGDTSSADAPSAGLPGPDLSVTGGTGDDTLAGGDGDDTVAGADGDDSLEGGAGGDTLDGGTGDDVVSGGAGEDVASGGDGADTVAGGDGNDSLYGGAGDDQVSGEAGDDVIDERGSAGNDTLLGGSGADTVYGGAGLDSLAGGDGADGLYGGDDADSLAGGAGDDRLYGEAGDDRLDESADLLGRNRLDGGAGADTLLAGQAGDSLYGGDGDDSLSGGADADDLDGGAGADTVAGGAGADRFVIRSGDPAGDVFVDFAGAAAGGSDQLLLADLAGTPLAGVALQAFATELMASTAIAGADLTVDGNGLGAGGLTTFQGVAALGWADFGMSAWSIAAVAATAAEGQAGAIEYVVTRSGDIATAATLALAVAGSGGFSVGADLTGSPTVTGATAGSWAAGVLGLSFAAGQAAATVGLGLANDAVPEPNDTITGTIGSFSWGGAAAGQSSAAIDVADDELQLTLTSATTALESTGSYQMAFGLPQAFASETVKLVVSAVDLSGGASDSAAAAQGLANAGDFTAFAARTIYLDGATGAVLSGNDVITLANDARYEGGTAQRFGLDFVSVERGTGTGAGFAANGLPLGGAGASYQIGIVDDEAQPIFSIERPVSLDEAVDSIPGSGSNSFVVGRSGSSEVTSSVTLTWADSADNGYLAGWQSVSTPGATYAGNGVTLNFGATGAGSTAQTVSLATLDDPAGLADLDTVVTVSVSGITNAGYAGAASFLVPRYDDEALASTLTAADIVGGSLSSGYQNGGTLAGTDQRDSIGLGTGATLNRIGGVTIDPGEGSGDAITLRTNAGWSAIHGNTVVAVTGDKRITLDAAGGIDRQALIYANSLGSRSGNDAYSLTASGANVETVIGAGAGILTGNSIASQAGDDLVAYAVEDNVGGRGVRSGAAFTAAAVGAPGGLNAGQSYATPTDGGIGGGGGAGGTRDSFGNGSPDAQDGGVGGGGGGGGGADGTAPGSGGLGGVAGGDGTAGGGSFNSAGGSQGSGGAGIVHAESVSVGDGADTVTFAIKDNEAGFSDGIGGRGSAGYLTASTVDGGAGDDVIGITVSGNEGFRAGIVAGNNFALGEGNNSLSVVITGNSHAAGSTAVNRFGRSSISGNSDTTVTGVTTISGGAGNDTVGVTVTGNSGRNAVAGVTVDLGAGSNSFALTVADGTTNSVSDVTLTGGAGADSVTIQASSLATTTIALGGGADSLTLTGSGTGNSYDAGSGDDVLTLATVAGNTIAGGTGHDSLTRSGVSSFSTVGATGISGIERLAFRDGAADAVTVDRLFLDQADMDGGARRLWVDADAGDTVILTDTGMGMEAGVQWAATGQTVVDQVTGATFVEYAHAVGGTVYAYVRQGATVNPIGLELPAGLAPAGLPPAMAVAARDHILDTPALERRSETFAAASGAAVAPGASAGGASDIASGGASGGAPGGLARWTWNSSPATLTWTMWAGPGADQVCGTGGLYDAVRSAFQAWSDATGIQFVERSTGLAADESHWSNATDISIAIDPAALAAMTGGNPGSYLGLAMGLDAGHLRATLLQAGLDPEAYRSIAGDFFLNGDLVAAAGLGSGELGAYAILQEIGHSLGLPEAGSEADPRPASADAGETVMVEEPGRAGGLAGGPGAADVAALRQLYGSALDDSLLPGLDELGIDDYSDAGTDVISANGLVSPPDVAPPAPALGPASAVQGEPGNGTPALEDGAGEGTAPGDPTGPAADAAIGGTDAVTDLEADTLAGAAADPVVPSAAPAAAMRGVEGPAEGLVAGGLVAGGLVAGGLGPELAFDRLLAQFGLAAGRVAPGAAWGEPGLDGLAAELGIGPACAYPRPTRQDSTAWLGEPAEEPDWDSAMQGDEAWMAAAVAVLSEPPQADPGEWGR